MPAPPKLRSRDRGKRMMPKPKTEHKSWQTRNAKRADKQTAFTSAKLLAELEQEVTKPVLDETNGA